MPSFTIPNEADAAFLAQSGPDKVDFDILTGPPALTGVVSGCAVTAQGTPDMTVAVAAGRVVVGGTNAAVTAGNVTITAADATNPRFDLVVASNAGALSAVAGTPAGNPVFPAIPANRVVLAAVYVPAADTAINANQIVDKRATVAPQSGGTATLLVAASNSPARMKAQADYVCDGTADDVEIQAAVNALPALGGTVVLAPGLYNTAATVVLGNGNSTTRSSVNGIALIGGGGQGYRADEMFDPGRWAVTWLWAGSAGGTMLKLQGPVAGLNVKGILLHCNDTAATGIDSQHPLASKFEYVTVTRYTGIAIKLQAYGAVTGLSQGADDNVWEEVNSSDPVGTTAEGIDMGTNLDGNYAAATLNVSRNTFINCWWMCSRTAGISAIRIRYIDVCSFLYCTGLPKSGAGVAPNNAIEIVPPGGASSGFPRNVFFFGTHLVGKKVVTGTWTNDYDGMGIVFWPYGLSDDQTLPDTHVNWRGVTTIGQFWGNWRGNAPLGSYSVPFTDGDTQRRVRVYDPLIVASSKILAGVRRPNDPTTDPDLSATFERGTLGATIAATDPGSLTPWYTVLIPTGGSVVYDNTHVVRISGAAAAKLLAGSAGSNATYLQWFLSGTTVSVLKTEFWLRAHFWFTAQPTVDTNIIAGSIAGSDGFVVQIPANTTRLFYVDSAAHNGGTTPGFKVGQMIRVEVHAIASTTVGFVEIKFWNDPFSTGTPDGIITSPANLNTLAGLDRVQFGLLNSTVPNGYGPVWVDDVGASFSAYLGPSQQPPDSYDYGYVYTPNVVRVGPGYFDALVTCSDGYGGDPVETPPNETIQLAYAIGG